MEQVKDQIIHGTKIFDKEPVLSGAEGVESTPLFEVWTGTGDVYHQIRKNAIAPRHFLESADQGTIALRFVVMAVNQNRTRVRIDAVYVESAHRVVHISDGTGKRRRCRSWRTGWKRHKKPRKRPQMRNGEWKARR